MYEFTPFKKTDKLSFESFMKFPNLYFFGILPAKNEYIELSPEYYKQKRKNNMIFEELNFLARHSFTSIADITKYKENLENKLPELKGKRELLWRKHKSADTNKKTKILKDINVLTEEIDKIQAQKNACNRIIIKYEEIKMEYKKERESKQKTQELILSEKRKRLEFKWMYHRIYFFHLTLCFKNSFRLL